MELSESKKKEEVEAFQTASFKRETSSAAEVEYNIENDPDMPSDTVNSNVIIEEIEMNGRKQKVYRKTYQLIDGKTKVITRMETM